MPLKLSLQKEGQAAPKLQLSLNKGSRFIVELFWDCNHDLDAHALLAYNSGNGAKVSSFEQVLSAYNTRKNNPAAALTVNGDGSFSTPCGTLTHSGDSRTGVGKDVDEMIVVDGSKSQNGMNEIPIFVTIHGDTAMTFAKVKSAGIRIKDDSGKELGSYELSGEFGGFNAVQMGSMVLSDKGWAFIAVGNGFMGDFNTVLSYFS